MASVNHYETEEGVLSVEKRKRPVHEKQWIKRMAAIAGIDLRKMRKDWRIPAILVLIIVAETLYTRSVFDCSAEIGYPVSPWLLPLLLADPGSRFVIQGCAVLFFCNLFSAGRQTPYVVMRSGRTPYVLGKLLYLLITSLAFTLVTAFAFVPLHLKDIVLTKDWGPLLGSWARYYAPMTSGGSAARLIHAMPALSAMGCTILLLWLSFLNIGAAVLFFQMLGSRIGSVLFLGALMALELVSANIQQLTEESAVIARMMWFSPLSWSNISLIAVGEGAYRLPYPSLSYVFGMSVGITVLWTAACIVYGRYAADWEEKNRQGVLP